MNTSWGRIAGAGLLAAAVVAGIGFTAVTVSHADRDPGKPVWKFPAADHHEGRAGKDASGLRGLLVPYSEGSMGYGRGPDIGAFGSDVELTGRQATALRKQSIRDLPPQTRRRLEEMIDKERIKGMAMRSYSRADSWSVSRKHAFTLSFELVRMDRDSVRALSTTQNQLFSALRFFRKGPAIEGHKNAACFLAPGDGGEKLDRMVCSAYEGDVLVGVDVSGHRPLDGNAVARFIGQQLDRIKDRGEAV
ncbi:hypothetical protein ACWEN3_03240 [Streptomyces sp. NPDC004561]